MQRISLNQSWQFAKIPDGTIPFTLEGIAWENVSLPHTWYTDEDPYHGVVVYHRELSTNPKWCKAFLEFEGADQVCRVFVNGRPVGEHRGGYARFRFPIPQEALLNGSLSIDVYLDNSINPEVLPNFGDFTVFGGLYRNVNILITEENHFDYLYYGTDGVIASADIEKDGTGIVSISSHVCITDPGVQIRYMLTGPDGELTASYVADPCEIVRLEVPAPRLWNGKAGVNLYTLCASLLTGMGEIDDEVSLRLGFRHITMSPEEGLRLNGERVKLCGVAKHQDCAGVFNAVSDRQIDDDFAFIREIGANAVRLSHYQHAQHTYSCCDEAGLLVWAEIPMLKMTESQVLLENAADQLRELILQNLHHPSIFCWGIQNEIGMFKDAPYMHEGCRMLTKLAKELDPNRLVSAANLYTVKFSSELNKITDMIGYNIYFGWYYGEMSDYGKYLDKLHAARPEMKLGVSEYGVDSNPALHSEEPKVKDYSEEYQALFHETVYPILRGKDYLWGSFVWNMFDFSSDRRNEGGVKFLNSKGLVSHDRSLRKDAFYYYKAVWSKEPFVHICSQRFIKRARKAIDIKVYTNQSSVVLTINGDEWGRAENNGNGTVVFRNVALRPGENTVCAVAGGWKDHCVFERVEYEDESYCLPDQGEGTVRNWFLSDDDTVKEGYYSIMDTADDVMQCTKAREVLMRYVPELVKAMDQDLIPLGLSMKSILSRDLKDDTDTMLHINDALHEIAKEY